MQERVANESKEMEIPRKNKKEMLKKQTNRNTVTEMKNIFDELINRPVKAEEKSKLLKLERKEKKTEEKKNITSKNCKKITMSIKHMHNRNTRIRKKKEQK